MLAIIGDFNARIGKDDGTFTYHQYTNRNGSLLLDFVNEKQLVVTNTSFQKKMNKMWTYMDQVEENTKLSISSLERSGEIVTLMWRHTVASQVQVQTIESYHRRID